MAGVVAPEVIDTLIKFLILIELYPSLIFRSSSDIIEKVLPTTPVAIPVPNVPQKSILLSLVVILFRRSPLGFKVGRSKRFSIFFPNHFNQLVV